MWYPKSRVALNLLPQLAHGIEKARRTARPRNTQLENQTSLMFGASQLLSVR